ncbi:DNA-binding PadR family transcriptional regulator [Murinocardiopsis flavida]|uniref:DNA-binding PadR family transcriptional regulator n=1 Tax=Murinocardiopsis flavida TaxID=645275 RepID=A0A2P8DIZ4_9ACTN|nr:PadR family transcriptional regulator [Murinocardiopsis flavida]PSK97195.1 DNA-binding PadR family transcriptional regulator [Murinocardiopsis flavida]
MTRKSELSTAQLTVLGLLDESPRHGFAIAKLLSPDGDVGRVWSLRPALVYRALGVVTERGLAAVAQAEDSAIGPQRTVYAITPEGRGRLWRWLVNPVEHIRDVRGELLLKLALLHRSGEDPRPLLRAQQAAFAPLAAAITERAAAPEDRFDRVLAVWRAESADATMRFLAALLAERGG